MSDAGSYLSAGDNAEYPEAWNNDIAHELANFHKEILEEIRASQAPESKVHKSKSKSKSDKGSKKKKKDKTPSQSDRCGHWDDDIYPVSQLEPGSYLGQAFAQLAGNRPPDDPGSSSSSSSSESEGGSDSNTSLSSSHGSPSAVRNVASGRPKS